MKGSLMLIAGLAITTAASAQLYSNAGGYGSGAIGLSTGTTTASGVAAPAGFVWSELQTEANFTNASAGFAASGGVTSGGFRVADNFTVNDSNGWNISSINFFGYVTGSAAASNPYTATTLRIWNGRPGDVGSSVIFGSDTTNLIAQTTVTNTNIYRIFATVVPGGTGTTQGTTRLVRQISISTAGLTLGQGTYWVDFSNSGGFIPAITAPGLRGGGVAGNAVQQTAANTWTAISDVGLQTGAPAVAQDIPFIINGTVVPTPAAAALFGMAGLAGLRRRR